MWRVDYIEYQLVERTINSKYGDSKTYFDRFPFPKTIVFKTKRDAETFKAIEIASNAHGQDYIKKEANSGICSKLEVKTLAQYFEELKGE